MKNKKQIAIMSGILSVTIGLSVWYEWSQGEHNIVQTPNNNRNVSLEYAKPVDDDFLYLKRYGYQQESNETMTTPNEDNIIQEAGQTTEETKTSSIVYNPEMFEGTVLKEIASDFHEKSTAVETEILQKRENLLAMKEEFVANQVELDKLLDTAINVSGDVEGNIQTSFTTKDLAFNLLPEQDNIVYRYTMDSNGELVVEKITQEMSMENFQLELLEGKRNHYNKIMTMLYNSIE